MKAVGVTDLPGRARHSLRLKTARWAIFLTAAVPDALMLDCLAYEAKPAAALAGIYTRSYSEERGRRKACAVIYRRIRRRWKRKK